MVLPRRVPWTSQGELSQLYEWLFSPSADEISKKRGLSRMNIYLSCPSCPTFIHLLHNLISVDLLPLPSTSTEFYSARLSLSMALVRFVNGMVDPLQSGPYARPISHLAQTINLPPSLITMRHRATHEDLPTYTALKQSVLMAIGWLHHYSFLPLLASSSNGYGAYEGDFTIESASGRVRELLLRWKKCMKVRLRERDADDKNGSAKELIRIKKLLDGIDMEDIVDGLCEEDGIVPTSRRKRPSPDALSPPTASIEIWVPLLRHLSNRDSAFTSLFADVLLNRVLADEPSANEAFGPIKSLLKSKKEDRASVRWTLAIWLLWMWQDLEGLASLRPNDKDSIWETITLYLRQNDFIVRRLAEGIVSLDSSRAVSFSVLETLLDLGEGETIDGLEEVPANVMDWEDRISLMEKNLLPLSEVDSLNTTRLDDIADSTESVDPASAPSTHPGTHPSLEEVGSRREAEPPGWRKLTLKEWTPCPIGMWGGHTR